MKKRSTYYKTSPVAIEVGEKTLRGSGDTRTFYIVVHREHPASTNSLTIRIDHDLADSLSGESTANLEERLMDGAVAHLDQLLGEEPWARPMQLEEWL